MGQDEWRKAVTTKENGEYKLELLVSYEIMLSESQERMVLTAAPGRCT